VKCLHTRAARIILPVLVAAFLTAGLAAPAAAATRLCKGFTDGQVCIQKNSTQLNGFVQTSSSFDSRLVGVSLQQCLGIVCGQVTASHATLGPNAILWTVLVDGTPGLTYQAVVMFEEDPHKGLKIGSPVTSFP
jgi:hypothetical protein